MSINLSESYYCSDTWSTVHDLGRVYFIDTSGTIFYLDVYNNGEIQTNGSFKITLEDTTLLTGCSSEISQLNNVDIKYISIPDNAFAYIFQDTQSLKASTILSGSYYRDNVKGNNYMSTTQYYGEKIIWYYHAPINDDTLFYQSCVCGPSLTGNTKNGVTKDACGGAWNTNDPTVNCSSVQTGNAPKLQPAYPINNKGSTAAIMGWVWAILAIVAIVIIGGIVLMILILAGVFKAGKTTLETVSESKEPKGKTMKPPAPASYPVQPEVIYPPIQTPRQPIEGIFDA